MYPMLSWGILTGVVLWVGILSYFFWREIRLLRRLKPKRGEEQDLRALLIDLSGRIDQVNKREKVAFKVLRDLADDQLFAMQKFALRRYNPYQDMGGDQSFSMALLDGKDSGFVITSLHTRSGTRVYAKMVESGTPKVSLSGDERETLDSAMRFSK